MTGDEARSLALGLPEVTEEPHHELSSFRVRGKIFATVPDGTHLRVLVGESEILAAVAQDPDTFAPFFWGKRLACMVVDLGRADPDQLGELLTEAWLRKAPKSLAISAGLRPRSDPEPQPGPPAGSVGPQASGPTPSEALPSEALPSEPEGGSGG